MLNPFTNVLGEPYVTETVLPTDPFKLRFAIRDHTSIKGMQPLALKQLQAAAAAAHAAGLSELRVVAAKGGGHKSHFAGSEWDVIGYKPDGSIWTPAERVAVARGARRAGATRFGLYSFGKNSLGSGTLHFGFGPEGYDDNVTWGYAGLTDGPLSRRYTDKDEIAFRDEVYSGKPYLGPNTAIAYTEPEIMTDASPAVGVIKSITSKPIIRKNSADASWNRVVQTSLLRFNPALGHDFVDGVFGRNTFKEIVKFQRMHGLRPDGVVGPRTWAALEAIAPSGGGGVSNIPSFAIAVPSAMREPGNLPVRDIAADHLNSYIVKDGKDHVVIPALSGDSRPLDESAAKGIYASSGQHFGKFADETSASDYQQALSGTALAVPAVPSPYDLYDRATELRGLSPATLSTRLALRDAVELAAMRERSNIAARRGSATAKRGQTAAFVREFRS